VNRDVLTRGLNLEEIKLLNSSSKLALHVKNLILQLKCIVWFKYILCQSMLTRNIHNILVITIE